jgi:hypothetical protein
MRCVTPVDTLPPPRCAGGFVSLHPRHPPTSPVQCWPRKPRQCHFISLRAIPLRAMTRRPQSSSGVLTACGGAISVRVAAGQTLGDFAKTASTRAVISPDPETRGPVPTADNLGQSAGRRHRAIRCIARADTHPAPALLPDSLHCTRRHTHSALARSRMRCIARAHTHPPARKSAPQDSFHYTPRHPPPALADAECRVARRLLARWRLRARFHAGGMVAQVGRGWRHLVSPGRRPGERRGRTCGCRNGGGTGPCSTPA